MKWLLDKYNEFNEGLASIAAKVLSSMEFFYLCVALDLFELPPVIAQHSIIVWCTYLSSVVFQLLALPLLAHQSKTGNEHHDRHADKLDGIQESLQAIKDHHGI